MRGEHPTRLGNKQEIKIHGKYDNISCSTSYINSPPPVLLGCVGGMACTDVGGRVVGCIVVAGSAVGGAAVGCTSGC